MNTCSKNEEIKLRDQLVALQDEYAEFSDYCAFLCDAVVALISDDSDTCLDRATAMGLQRQCEDLKVRMRRLEKKMPVHCP